MIADTANTIETIKMFTAEGGTPAHSQREV